ncbi:hypothetical protein L6164_031343 [Bauhinia variegata]|uniref:Uncharacterized protein n=1 Tax=Bauhinia variegata TaxID=167791 RepID=A0ACB9LGF7_BAUVA|nr:hypothetical protein L6164_031343 [Bauhinia variegata]
MLISYYSQSLEEVTAQGETVDHLAEGKKTTGDENAKLSDITEEEGNHKELENDLLSSNKVEDKTADKNMMSESSASTGKDTKIITIDLEPVDDESKWKTSKGLTTEMKKIALIMAILAATVTYQAGLSPPPTIWKEGTKLDTRCLLKNLYKYIFLGSSIECSAANFYLFMISDTAGFMVSLFTIFIFSPVITM